MFFSIKKAGFAGLLVAALAQVAAASPLADAHADTCTGAVFQKCCGVNLAADGFGSGGKSVNQLTKFAARATQLCVRLSASNVDDGCEAKCCTNPRRHCVQLTPATSNDFLQNLFNNLQHAVSHAD